MLNIIDEFSRKCLVIRVKRKLNSTDVVDALTDILIVRDPPAYIRSEMDRGLSLKPSSYGSRPRRRKDRLYIEPGSTWENGYCKSFAARFTDELLNGEIFCSQREAQIAIKQWRRHYNTKRPH